MSLQKKRLTLSLTHDMLEKRVQHLTWEFTPQLSGKGRSSLESLLVEQIIDETCAQFSCVQIQKFEEDLSF